MSGAAKELGEAMKRQIANIITGCRIICSIGMLFCPVCSVGFAALYLLAGLSDMVDGTVARELNAVSAWGARWDTVADLSFTAVAGVKLLPVLPVRAWIWAWIAVIALIKIGNVAGGWISQKKFVALHTRANKVTGLLLFAFPLTLPWVDMNVSAAIVCAVATFAAVQESGYVIAGCERG